MRKYKLLLFLMLFFVSFDKVDAASVSVCNSSGYHNDLAGSSGCSSSVSAITDNNSFVYEIQSLKFDANFLSVSGFGILREVNNTENDYWLIAESATGEVYVSSKFDGSGGDGNLDTLYYSPSGAKYADGTLKCKTDTSAKGTYNLLLNSHYKYRIQGSWSGYPYSKKSEWVACLAHGMASAIQYKNVEFNLNMNLSTLKQTFEKDTDIELKLLMKNGSNYYLTGIHVYNGDISNDTSVSKIKNVSSNILNNTKVNVLAQDAYIRNSSNKVMKYNNGPLFGKFNSGSSYYYDSVITTTKPRLYGLRIATGSNIDLTNGGGTPIYKGTSNTSGKYIVGYAYSFWLNIDGKTTFQLVEGRSVDCESELCIGSNCKNSYEITEGTCPIKKEPLDVRGTTKSTIVDKCESFSNKSLSNQVVEKKILYYKVPNYQIIIDEQIINNVKIVGKTYKLNNSTVISYDDNGDGISDGALIPITFLSKFNYTQRYSFVIDNSFVQGMEVEVRRGFPFKFDYDIQYLRGIVSNAIGTDLNYSYSTSNNSYNGTISNISIYDESIGGYKEVNLNVRLTGDDYLYDSSGKNGIKYSNIYNTSVFVDKNSIHSVGEVQLTFPNSSDADKESFETKEQFSCASNGLGSGYNCNYDLPVAYWKNDSNMYPVIKYGSSYQNNTGYHVLDESKNLYYVAYNYPLGASLSFDIDADDLGIIDGSIIGFDITCSVNVSNFDVMDKLIYRTIDVSNPFPIGEMGDNWKKYSKLDNDFSRIKNTFSCVRSNSDECVSYRTDVFSNLDRGSINNISSVLGRYASFKDIDNATGNSKVISNVDAGGDPLFTINGKPLFVINRGNHNIYGEFDVDKDKAQGT